MAEWVTGTIIQVQHWNNNLFRIILQAPIATFQAGQFVKLSLEIEKERIQRAYSCVNAPSNPLLEFYLVLVPNGKLSPHLYALQPGDEIFITQTAAGYLVLDEIPNCKTLWMLATGTAIGPYLSILQQGGLERFEDLVLVHAVRYAQDLNYLPLMQQLQQRYKGKLRIQTVVSRETVADSLTGRLPALIADGSLEAAIGRTMTPEDSHIMLCGNPQMVRDTQKLLQETRAMTKHLRRKPGHITSEHYW